MVIKIVFNKLRKLSDFLFDRFTINEIYSTLRDENRYRDEKFKKYLEIAKTYLNTAKAGFLFYTKGKNPEQNIRETLIAFNSLMDAIEKRMETEKFEDEEFSLKIDQLISILDKLLNNDDIQQSEIDDLSTIFCYIGSSLSNRINKITQKENNLFKMEV